jgi:hypothetical protein
MIMSVKPNMLIIVAKKPQKYWNACEWENQKSRPTLSKGIEDVCVYLFSYLSIVYMSLHLFLRITIAALRKGHWWLMKKTS